ncbi:tRNA preQ1(34) S-adenosylmethionine ribosyltransferase-isomerase QueA [Limnoglobus roseus]|uniref:S-adenosylmethionine:tRNA ribosyltransferase-isomerase n=1 Tax=Limnoglobus roseus TaxID=2598579 RepID=A0A5C1AI65_9BACT|nr:tRNA preQ1(34) S-adenosylmethionine ribosyltransferase-isomerase QueA [Limnoglobus roseus]QEL17362.1 tRNA preQ1(34) S-adenosylmethionine ribosyltransferase-isomerase QueA [Limnoglobus roseus]
MHPLFFDYDLPERLIAQEPTARRDDARLLVVRRGTQALEHRHVRDLPQLLRAGDRLVLNDTRVLPARLIGERANTGGKWEGLFLRDRDGEWELMAKTRGYPKLGERIVTDTGLSLTLIGRTSDKHWLMRPDATGSALELLQKFGQIPLPPYIRKGRAGEPDAERYQTVYARAAGSVAAPTAGLHFTPELFAALSQAGVGRASVTLHVGLGTFAPIKSDDPTQHEMHSEWCEVPATTVEAIRQTKAAGGRVIAVGTTTARTLESAALPGELQAFIGETNIFIHPPFAFRVLDGLLTNFHLPRTTLLLLVQALAGSELLQRAYEEAIREEYRFYSYGDAMLVL